MCKTAYYISADCKCRWWRVMQPCAPGMGFNNCPTFYTRELMPAPPEVRVRAASNLGRYTARRDPYSYPRCRKVTARYDNPCPCACRCLECEGIKDTYRMCLIVCGCGHDYGAERYAYYYGGGYANYPGGAPAGYIAPAAYGGGVAGGQQIVPYGGQAVLPVPMQVAAVAAGYPLGQYAYPGYEYASGYNAGAAASREAEARAFLCPVHDLEDHYDRNEVRLILRVRPGVRFEYHWPCLVM